MLLLSAGDVGAVAFARSGLNPCSCQGSLVQVEVCGKEGSYVISGSCNCDTTFTFTARAHAEYRVVTNDYKAVEIITLSTGQTANTSWTCPSDPWLNQVQCSNGAVSGNAFSTWQILPDTIHGPMTAPVIPAAQRDQYREQEAQPCPLPPHRAPKVESPTPGQVFTGDILVTVKEQDDDALFVQAGDYPGSSWKFYIQFEAVASIQPQPSAAQSAREAMKVKVPVSGASPTAVPTSVPMPRPGHLAIEKGAASPALGVGRQPQAIMPSIQCNPSGYGSDTLTRSPGKWKLRARVWSPKQPEGAWSDWVEFEVR